MVKGMSAAVAAMALAVSPVQAACWNADESTAASVRDLQSLLMVATLRCQVARHDMVADYNGFLQANKATIQKLNDRLKAHFIKAAGAVGGQRAYDSFATTLANAYGAAASSESVCSGMASLAREAQMMAGSEEGLLLLAQREGLAPRLPEGACGLAASSVAMASAPASTSTSTMASATMAGGASLVSQTIASGQ